MAITASVKGSITITDNLTGSVSLSKPLSQSFTGDLSTYGQSLTVGTSNYAVSLPNNLAQFVYVKNLSANAGTTLTVTWTPNSGGSAIVIILDPGACIIFSEVNASNGISSMTLVSNQLGTPVEFILAG